MELKKTNEKKYGKLFTAENFLSDTGITLKHPERVELKVWRVNDDG